MKGLHFSVPLECSLWWGPARTGLALESRYAKKPCNSKLVSLKLACQTIVVPELLQSLKILLPKRCHVLWIVNMYRDYDHKFSLELMFDLNINTTLFHMLQLKCVWFWVCIPMLHFIYITEDWNITKPFDIHIYSYLFIINIINIPPMRPLGHLTAGKGYPCQ